MLTTIDDFLRYFDGVHRRTLRDIQALPPAASGWAPDAGEGEGSWSVNEVVAHLSNVRDYMTSAYLGNGWLAPEMPDTSDWASWAPVIQASAERLQASLAGTPDAWLNRRVRAIASNETIVGWRILLMMVEHEVHHRSQLDTYAGLNGWEPPQIYGLHWEQVMGMQDIERAKLSTGN